MTQMPPASYEWTPIPPPLPKPKWPTVVGIISICLGALGLLSGAWSLVRGGKYRQFSASGAGQVDYRSVFDSLPAWVGQLQMVNQAANVVMAAMLLVGGIMLLKHVPAGRLLHLLYAALAIPSCIVAGVLVDYIMRGMQSEVFSQSPHAPPPELTGMAVGITRFAAFAGVLLGMAYPTFLLIWLNRKRVREHVKSWR